MKPEAPDVLILTEKQREILPLLAEGLSNDAIGKKVFISRSAVKYHLRQLYKKLDLDIQECWNKHEDMYDKRLKLAFIAKEMFG